MPRGDDGLAGVTPRAPRSPCRSRPAATVFATPRSRPRSSSPRSRRPRLRRPWRSARSTRYAGIVGPDVTTGVRARIVALSPPAVDEGHVAVWTGVGGLDVGPNGEDEWIQVGLASFEGSTTRLYYEIMRGDRWPEYVEVDSDVAPGELHRVAVEIVGRLVTGASGGPPSRDAAGLPSLQPSLVGACRHGGELELDRGAVARERLPLPLPRALVSPREAAQARLQQSVRDRGFRPRPCPHLEPSFRAFARGAGSR